MTEIFHFKYVLQNTALREMYTQKQTVRGCLKKEAGQTKKQRPAARKRLVFAVQLKYEKTICTKGL